MPIAYLGASLSSESLSVSMNSCSTVRGKERSFTHPSGDCSSFSNEVDSPEDRSFYFNSHGFSQDSDESRPLISNRLDDIIQCSQLGPKLCVLVTSASYPFHVEWVSSDWSKKCGWSSDEILGLDCKFLQGDATDFKRVRAFMRDLMASGGKANLDILNYNKDDTLSHNVSYCVPIVDDCGHDNSQEVSHIALVLVKSSEVHHSSDCADLLEGRVLEEVGMPLDRREGCNAYPHRQIVPAPGVSDWLRLTDGLPLALMLRYMLRTQAPIVLIDRMGRIVHVNLPWVNLTGYTGMECEGRVLQSLLDHDRDPEGSQHFDHLLHWLNTQNNIKMHVNVHLTKKPKSSSCGISRRNSTVSTIPGYFGSQSVYSSDSLPTLPEMTPSADSGSDAMPRCNSSSRRSPDTSGGLGSAYRSMSNSLSSRTVTGRNISPPHAGSIDVNRADSQTSLFSTPLISRRSSRGGEPDLGFQIESFPVQLSPVPIGQKHFAVLCIPYSSNTTTPAPTANPTPVYRDGVSGQLNHIFGTAADTASAPENQHLETHTNNATIPTSTSTPIPIPTSSTTPIPASIPAPAPTA